MENNNFYQTKKTFVSYKHSVYLALENQQIQNLKIMPQTVKSLTPLLRIFQYLICLILQLVFLKFWIESFKYIISHSASILEI